MLEENIETFIYTNKYHLSKQIEARKKSLNVNYYIPVRINDYLDYGDLYGMGLIYMIKDKKNIKKGKYTGQDKNCRNIRKYEHKHKATSLLKNDKPMADIQYYILKNINRYEEDFEYKILEIVVYKTTLSLDDREQFYIDKFDTYVNGLNSKLVKRDKNKLMRRRTKNNYLAFRRYTGKINRMVKTFNEYFNYNGDYEFYKKLIESKKQNVIDFIDLYIYDKKKDNDKFELLLDYILYRQTKRNKKYLKELVNINYDKSVINTDDDKSVDNNVVDKSVVNNNVDNNNVDNSVDDKQIENIDNDNIIVINIIDSNDIINIDVIDEETVIIDVI